MEKIRVVIADDIDLSRAKIRMILNKIENIEIVAEASDGYDLYNKVLEYKPELVFTDNQMPVWTGIESIKRIKMEAENNPYFVLVTGDTIAKCEDAFRIVIKPYEEDEIIKVIDDYNKIKMLWNK